MEALENEYKLDYEERLAESKRIGFMRDNHEVASYRLMMYRHEEEKKKGEKDSLKVEVLKSKQMARPSNVGHFSSGGKALIP